MGEREPLVTSTEPKPGSQGQGMAQRQSIGLQIKRSLVEVLVPTSFFIFYPLNELLSSNTETSPQEGEEVGKDHLSRFKK